MGEVVLAVALALVGAALLRTVRPQLDTWVTGTVAGLAGSVTLSIVVGSGVLLGLHTSYAAIVTAAGLSLGAWAFVERRRGTLPDGARALALAAGLVGPVCMALVIVVEPVLTFDSWRFLEHGSSAFDDGDTAESLRKTLLTYPLQLVAIEGLARAAGAPYTVAAVVATGITSVAAGALVMLRPTSGREAAKVVCSTLAILAAVLSSAYMLRMQAALLNSHMAVAGLYAVGVGSALARRGPGDDPDGESPVTRADEMFLLGLACAGLALSRVEGLLVVTLLVIAGIGRRSRSVALFRLWLLAAAVPSAWYLALAVLADGDEILTSATATALVVIVNLPFALAAVPRAAPLLRWLPLMALLGIVAGLVGLSALAPDLMSTSVSAVVTNLASTGGWGATWLIVLPLLGLSLGRLWRDEDLSAWALVTLGFVATVVALGGIRSLPYRVGWDDSANRMLFHMLPAVGLLCVTALRRSRAALPDDAAWHAHGD